MKECYIYEKLEKENVQCKNCSHYCIIAPGERGICGVKENISGKLFSVNYSKIIALNIDPIEKKPLYHFLPGTMSLSFAAAGCPFSCLWCQNHDISQGHKNSKIIYGENLSPQYMVEKALDNKLQSISYTYSDPIAFSELAIDTMKSAKKNNLKNVWVTSGFLSVELFETIFPYLDAVNIDLKGNEDTYYKYTGGKIQPVLDNLIRMKKNKIWTEITTLVVPEVNNDEKYFDFIAGFIKNYLGDEIPWHVTRFCGSISWKMKHLPDTDAHLLEKAWESGKKAGLKYVYTGNIHGLSTENTYCYKCGNLCINRHGYYIKRYDENGKCPKCNESLSLIDN